MSNSTFIVDPATGSATRVINRRLAVDSLTSTTLARAADNGHSFDASSGLMTLTGSNETAALYLRNDHTSFVLRPARVSVSLGRAVDGTSRDVILRVYDTTRSELYGSEPALVSNRLLGQAASSEVTAIRGGPGITWAPGAHLLTPVVLQAESRAEFTTEVSMPLGTSILLTIEPPAETLAMIAVVYTVLEFYRPSGDASAIAG